MKHMLKAERNISQVRYIKQHVLGPSKEVRINTYHEKVFKVLSSRTGMPRTWATADSQYLN